MAFIDLLVSETKSHRQVRKEYEMTDLSDNPVYYIGLCPATSSSYEVRRLDSLDSDDSIAFR
jgi:hypothetical protein